MKQHETWFSSGFQQGKQRGGGDLKLAYSKFSPNRQIYPQNKPTQFRYRGPEQHPWRVNNQ